MELDDDKLRLAGLYRDGDGNYRNREGQVVIQVTSDDPRISYFVATGDSVEYYESEQKARQMAQAAIDDWCDACDPEWPEEVEQVCWGMVCGQAVAVWQGEYVNYELRDTI